MARSSQVHSFPRVEIYFSITFLIIFVVVFVVIAMGQ